MGLILGLVSQETLFLHMTVLFIFMRNFVVGVSSEGRERSTLDLCTASSREADHVKRLMMICSRSRMNYIMHFEIKKPLHYTTVSCVTAALVRLQWATLTYSKSQIKLFKVNLQTHV